MLLINFIQTLMSKKAQNTEGPLSHKNPNIRLILSILNIFFKKNEEVISSVR